jgi:hypothetical protein
MDCYSNKLERKCEVCKKTFEIQGFRKNTARFCSYICQRKNWKMVGKYRGKNNPGWIHGKYPENKRIRHTSEYLLWRTSVFMRDNYTCQVCGQHGGKLNADHIKPFSLYPELRFAIDNGRTLCIECHRKTDTWGFRLNRENIYKIPAIEEIKNGQ